MYIYISYYMYTYGVYKIIHGTRINIQVVNHSIQFLCVRTLDDCVSALAKCRFVLPARSVNIGRKTYK